MRWAQLIDLQNQVMRLNSSHQHKNKSKTDQPPASNVKINRTRDNTITLWAASKTSENFIDLIKILMFCKLKIEG